MKNKNQMTTRIKHGLSRSIFIAAFTVLSFSVFYSCSEKTAVVDTTAATASAVAAKVATPEVPILKSVSLGSVGSLPIATTPLIATDPLLAGQTYVAGSVVIETILDGTVPSLKVTYNLTNGWSFQNVAESFKLWIGKSLADMPQNKNGQPQIGGFPYKVNATGTSASYVISLASLGYTTCTANVFYVAAHADVTNGTTQTAWAQGTQQSSGSWWMYYTITVQDNTPPSISGALPDLTINGCTAADAPAAVTTVDALKALSSPALVISDDMSTEISVSSADAVTADGCGFLVTRTYTVSDKCGNPSTIVQKITVKDQTAPVIAGTLPVVTVEGCSAANAPAAATTVDALKALGLTISDNCTLAANVLSKDVSTGSCPVVVTRTYTISDGCGNTATTVQTINIQDTTAPTASNPATINASCDFIPAPDVAVVTDARDNCGGAVTVSFVGDQINGSGCSYSITRTYKVVDACGNATTVAQTINVADKTPPVISAPGADATIACGVTPVFTAPTATDNCSAVTVSQVGTDLIETGTGYVWTTRTWVATDACGNVSAPVSQKIINDCSNIPTPSGPSVIANGTGWAYDAVLSKTFSSIANKTSNNWGWTNGLIAQSGTPYKFSLIVGAGQNDLSKGIPVGDVTVSYTAAGAVVTLKVVSSVKINGAQVYVGKDVLPKSKQGVYQSAPGQLGNNSGTLNGVNTYTFTIKKLADGSSITATTGSVYVAIHADIASK